VVEVAGAEAARMLVPLTRSLAREAAENEEMRLGMLADLHGHADDLQRHADNLQAHAADLQGHADRLEAALGAVTVERDRAVRRARRLRRRLRGQEKSLSWRLTRPLRAVRRRR
jgi:hypothetical protein